MEASSFLIDDCVDSSADMNIDYIVVDIEIKDNCISLDVAKFETFEGCMHHHIPNKVGINRTIGFMNHLLIIEFFDTLGGTLRPRQPPEFL